MKGNFDDDDKISSKDAEKKYLDQILVYFLKTIQLFVVICLFISRDESRSGRNHIALGEKKRKRNN